MGETVSNCLAALLVAIPVLFGAFTQNTASFWSRWLEPSVGNSYLKKLYVLLSFQFGLRALISLLLGFNLRSFGVLKGFRGGVPGTNWLSWLQLSLCHLMLFVLSSVLVTCIFVWKIKLGSKNLYAKFLDMCFLSGQSCAMCWPWQQIKQFLNLVAQGKRTSPRT